MSQIVDTASAKEFMNEVLGNVSSEELIEIVGMLEVKSRFFQRLLGNESIGQLSETALLQILRSIFSTRRKSQQILESHPIEVLREHIAELLYGEKEVQFRFQNFCEQLEGVDTKTSCDLAGELLHFTLPGQYWLWSRWMWDAKAKTGSLPLVVTEEFDLNAPALGDTYLKVGKATAFVHHTGEAAGFQNISRSLFGTDVFLGCVYVIYSYTVLRMRMTQEFNKVVPGLAEFTKRLFGVNRMDEYGLAWN